MPMEQLPVFLDLKQSSCLVIGGGSIAERKIKLLIRASANVTVVSPTLTSALKRMLDDGKICHIGAMFKADEDTQVNLHLLENRRLVVVAIGDRKDSRAIAKMVMDAGVLCNVVDDPEVSNFIFPAIVDRSPVVIAIGTGGNAPVLALKLKAQIEQWLPARISMLAQKAGRWRALVKRRFSTLRERRTFWQNFFEGPIADHLLANRVASAEKLFRKQLIGEARPRAQVPGEAYIVGAGPGDPGLVTIRAHQLIRQSDVVLYDRLVSEEILDYARKDALQICVGKQAGRAVMRQSAINALLVTHVSQGKRVCRLKGGDPFIFGRGGEEVDALVNAGLPYQVVPGISAALGCAAYAGIPLTYRGVSRSVIFATSTRKDQSDLDWASLSLQNQTLVLYMGVSKIGNTVLQLTRHGLSGDTPVAMIENGTTSQQRVLHSTLNTLHRDADNQSMHAPAILVVGETAAMGRRFGWFESLPEIKAVEQDQSPWVSLPAMQAR